jgi:hypothetical protein
VKFQSNGKRRNFGVYNMTMRYTTLSLLAAACLALLGGCADLKVEPSDSYQFSRADEIPPGPGIFTGEKGEWVIFSR